MKTPQLNVPLLYAGQPAVITWDAQAPPDGYSIAYQLMRKYDTEPGYSLLYSGPATSYTDTMPLNGASSVEYTLVAYTEVDITWTEHDAEIIANNVTWEMRDAEIIANNITWAFEISPQASSGGRTITPNRPPIISGTDADLGSRYHGFDITFAVTDPDPNNTVSVVVKLDADTLLDIPAAQQGVEYTATVTDEQIFAMLDGSTHAVVITATDNWGASSTRTYTFTAVEDLISSAVFYVLRDGIPVARLADASAEGQLAWQDYMAAGTHTYVVRAVDRYDNFVDSNPVTLTINIDYVTLAPTQRPQDMLALTLRRGEPPGVSRSHGINGEMTALAGRKYPVYTDSGMRTDTWQLQFTHRTLAEYEALFALLDSGIPVVYRDCFNNVIVGRAPSLGHDFVRRARGRPSGPTINFNVTLERIDYTEEIAYD